MLPGGAGRQRVRPSTPAAGSARWWRGTKEFGQARQHELAGAAVRRRHGGRRHGGRRNGGGRRDRGERRRRGLSSCSGPRQPGLAPGGGLLAPRGRRNPKGRCGVLRGNRGVHRRPLGTGGDRWRCLPPDRGLCGGSSHRVSATIVALAGRFVLPQARQGRTRGGLHPCVDLSQQRQEGLVTVPPRWFVQPRQGRSRRPGRRRRRRWRRGARPLAGSGQRCRARGDPGGTGGHRLRRVRCADARTP